MQISNEYNLYLKPIINSLTHEYLKTAKEDENNAGSEILAVIAQLIDIERKIEQFGFNKIPKNICNIYTRKNYSEDVYKVAYFFSRFDSKILFKDINKSKAFEFVAQELDANICTLKLLSNMYDPFFDNGRKGLSKRQLAPCLQKVLDHYNKLQEKDILLEVQEILNLSSDDLMCPNDSE